MILSIDEVNEILDDLAEELPEAVFRNLSGGVSLLEEERHPEGAGSEDLFLMGEYCVGPMGRYINIYYGSFVAVFADASRKGWVRQLRKTLRHELTHHLENQAGCRDLEIEDEREMDEYLRRNAGAEYEED